MGKCLPSMPCYNTQDVQVYTTYPKGCTSSSPGPFSLPLSSDNVYYAGPNLPYTGIQTLDELTVALQRIDALLSQESIFDLFIAAIDNNPALKTELCSRISTCP